jgi:NTE family protein
MARPARQGTLARGGHPWGASLENVLGLAMTGGGARGAYQAGVLKRIGEIKRVQTEGNPFPVIGGASAGAINGTAVAVGSDDFAAGTRILAQLWSELTPSDVFRCDLMAQTRNSLTWIMDLSFGGVLGGGNARSLLDATPLRRFLGEHLDCGRIQENIKRGHLYALAISATNYGSGKSYLFIQGAKGHPMWQRSRRVTLATKITVDHVCASAAIPVVFPPVQLKTSLGTAFFGDGCMRLSQPLSPLIRLGAERVFAIGVRCENRGNEEESSNGKPPSMAEVAGLLCNVMFLDHLATDIEHLERLNELLDSGQLRNPGNGSQKMRPLRTFYIAPSVDLSDVAAEHRTAMPYLISYFVNSLGRDADSCSALMSYLLFTSEYTNALIDIGYHDADERIDEIEDFLYSPENRGN